jgi:hypothetical protein
VQQSPHLAVIAGVRDCFVKWVAIPHAHFAACRGTIQKSFAANLTQRFRHGYDRMQTKFADGKP